ncbi:hydroxyectoine utilization dehydratase EutB [Phyllobacterium sp. 21LDTY02-6]|uniref:hydroxyectoine utilization dehydratase EutB n=1 Tax=Phyllobacterium sp. 21LDTY02-6 TaxID=2944903 RepID=UPI002020719B|nr:hydroxyectoine utilization dehydratase EutB [Phyllobacterium sp. 21LDTY02-6]MCO4316639.1 hydroxyectoine utilization dehydratase EutB [Phyllobacterium sp. 21LDTY02-6]
MVTEPVTLADIETAREAIRGRVLRTPMVRSNALSELAGVPVLLKLEHHQTTGSFKLRGASNAVARLDQAQKRRGVVAASTGNHGRALAYAASLEGMRATICLSRLVPSNKVEEIRRLGAEIRIVGKSQDDAQEEVERLVEQEGLIMIPPFDHAAIIAGQGTLGLEIVEDVPDVTSVLVPLSGGGLIAGVAAAVKGRAPNARIVGISMDRGAAMYASLAAGRPVLVEESESLADSLGGGIGLDNRFTFAMARALVDEVILLDEEQIAAGIVHAYREEREIVEGAAAVGIAAILAGKARLDGPTVIVLSGRNIDMNQHLKLICSESASSWPE